MSIVVYLLHRFPEFTDTFIRREIRCLQELGTEVKVVSIWKPHDRQTSPELLSEWEPDTHYLLPHAPLAAVGILLATALRAPAVFIATLRLAVALSRPGMKGILYQCIYFFQAILAAEAVRKIGARHLHNHIGDQSGTVTVLASRLSGVGYSITFHGWPVFFDAHYSRIKEKVRGARFTRSISYFCRSQLMMFSESTDPSTFKVVHCGVHPEKYDFQLPRPEARRLFCAARLSAEKGHTVILKALKLLLDAGIDVELELAGSGPCLDELKAMTRELAIEEHVHFLGSLSEAAVAERLKMADVFVLSSFVEGIPVSAMEAMAAGVPVVATNIAGTSELIENGRTGLLVRPSDPRALADAISTLTNDYEFRLRAAELGRKKIEEEFNVETESQRLNVYLLQSCT